jgi:hypothetical protein
MAALGNVWDIALLFSVVVAGCQLAVWATEAPARQLLRSVSIPGTQRMAAPSGDLGPPIAGLAAIDWRCDSFAFNLGSIA